MHKSIVSTALAATLLGAMAFSTSAAATDLAPQTMGISGTVLNSCMLFVDDYITEFDGVASTEQHSAPLQVLCNQDTAWTLSMGQGENFGQASRQPSMRALSDGNGHFVPYELFTDASDTVPFDGANLTGVGTGDWVINEIGMVFHDISYVPQGTYTDHVDVTLSFN